MKSLGKLCLVKYKLKCYDCDIIYVTPERKELQYEKGLTVTAKCQECGKKIFSKRIVGPIIDLGLISI